MYTKHTVLYTVSYSQTISLVWVLRVVRRYIIHTYVCMSSYYLQQYTTLKEQNINTLPNWVVVCTSQLHKYYEKSNSNANDVKLKPKIECQVEISKLAKEMVMRKHQ